jgi:hypothetical protein
MIFETTSPKVVSTHPFGRLWASPFGVFRLCSIVKQWREQNPKEKGNIRDYANVSQLVCLSNLENLNAVFINDKLPQAERLTKLNQIAIQQMKILVHDTTPKLDAL